MPTRQRVRAVQLAHAATQLAAGARVWETPDVLTPQGWARRECERAAAAAAEHWPRILSATEEWVLWRQATREAARGLPFLDEDLLAESLQQAAERAAEYGISLGAAAPDSEAGLLREAQRGFAARCRELNAASVSALTARLRAEPQGRALVLRGFDCLSARLAALAAPRAPPRSATPTRSATVARGVRTPDAQSQLEAIAEWCRARLLAQPDARLLVMLPGPAGMRERLAALIRAALDPTAWVRGADAARALVGIEGGEPLGLIGLPAQALFALALLSGAETDPQACTDWLTAPYWASPAPAARAGLALMLRQRGFASLNLRELLGALQLAPPQLKSAARELDARLRQAGAVLGESRAAAPRWSEHFEGALAALTWPGPLPPDSALQQTRLRWRELLEEFGGLAASLGTLQRADAVATLRALALRTAYRPEDEDGPVMLSPMLADPVVHYDGIWVGSLSADVLPQPVAPDPFLPLHAQLAAGLPHASAAGRRAQAEALLGAWRAATGDLVLSVPTREKDLELLPSPSLAGVTLAAHNPVSLWLPLRLRRGAALEHLQDTRGLPFNPLAPLPSGTRALTLQNQCAFRAYAELRLGAAAPQEAQPGIPMDQRGLLLHAALQGLWERLRDSAALQGLEPGALDALIADCVAQAARGLQVEVRGGRRRARRASDGQFDLFTVLSPALARECRRAQGLIRRLCELERTRMPFTVEATEQLTELALGGGRVRMRLDRIDRIEGGRVVLDYKSGRPGNPDWYGERPTHPQLLAYLAALGSDVLALATVNVTAREVRFAGVAAAADLLPRVKALPAHAPGADWPAQQRAWEALIERLIRDFLAGEARVDPAPGACDHCHVTDICRIGAHSSPEGPAAAEDADE